MTVLARLLAAAEDVGHTLVGWVGTAGGVAIVLAVAFGWVE